MIFHFVCQQIHFSFIIFHFHVGCVRGIPEIQEAASWYMEACIGGVRSAAVNLALLLRKGSIMSVQSLDGMECYSLSDLSIWLENCVKKMNMSDSSREELDILVAQLIGENLRIDNRYRLEKESMGGQLESSRNRHPTYSGNDILAGESYRDTDRYRGREEVRGYSDDLQFNDTEITRERERENGKKWAWEMEKERERERERQFGPRVMH